MCAHNLAPFPRRLISKAAAGAACLSPQTPTVCPRPGRKPTTISAPNSGFTSRNSPSRHRLDDRVHVVGLFGTGGLYKRGGAGAEGVRDVGGWLLGSGEMRGESVIRRSERPNRPSFTRRRLPASDRPRFRRVVRRQVTAAAPSRSRPRLLIAGQVCAFARLRGCVRAPPDLPATSSPGNRLDPRPVR